METKNQFHTVNGICHVNKDGIRIEHQGFLKWYFENVVKEKDYRYHFPFIALFLGFSGYGLWSWFARDKFEGFIYLVSSIVPIILIFKHLNASAKTSVDRQEISRLLLVERKAMFRQEMSSFELYIRDGSATKKILIGLPLGHERRDLDEALKIFERVGYDVIVTQR